MKKVNHQSIRLTHLFAQHWKSMLFIVLLTVLSSGIGLLTPWLAGDVVNAAIQSKDLTRLNHLALLLIAVFAVSGVLSFLNIYWVRATGERLALKLRSKTFGHLVGLSPSFFDEHRIGELLSRMGDDISKIRKTLIDEIPNGIRSILLFIGTIFVLIYMDPGLTLTTLCIIPPVIVSALWYGSKLQKASKRAQKSLAVANGDAEEALSGIRTVQSFNNQAFEKKRYDNKLSSFLSVQLQLAKISGLFQSLLQFVGFSAFAVVLWMGGKKVANGSLSPGDLTRFILYLFSIAGSVSGLGSLYGSLRSVKGSSERLFELLNQSSHIIDTPSPIQIPNAPLDITFNSVGFAYSKTNTALPLVLNDVSLHIQSGETVALVGPSGAGKTTLFSLLLRFYDPNQGHVTIAGKDIRQFSLTSLRELFAIVSQELFLFSGTIKENMSYGKEFDDDELWAALKHSGAKDFVKKLPLQLNALVGERGVKLSTGQKQRLAVARAYLRDPKILLLDEATSSLDSETEESITQSLEQLRQGRTTLIIAHRLATAKQADRIVVIDNGKITDTGTHSDLLSKNSLYKRYWDLQSLDGKP